MDKKEISNEEAIKKIVLNQNQNSNIAIIFGGEQSGLTNDDLSLVSECVSIETDISQAQFHFFVQILHSFSFDSESL